MRFYGLFLPDPQFHVVPRRHLKRSQPKSELTYLSACLRVGLIGEEFTDARNSLIHQHFAAFGAHPVGLDYRAVVAPFNSALCRKVAAVARPVRKLYKEGLRRLAPGTNASAVVHEKLEWVSGEDHIPESDNVALYVMHRILILILKTTDEVADSTKRPDTIEAPRLSFQFLLTHVGYPFLQLIFLRRHTQPRQVQPSHEVPKLDLPLGARTQGLRLFYGGHNASGNDSLVISVYAVTQVFLLPLVQQEVRRSVSSRGALGQKVHPRTVAVAETDSDIVPEVGGEFLLLLIAL